MSENTTKTDCSLEIVPRLDDVVIHETDAADLMRFENGRKMLGCVQIRIFSRMVDIDQNMTYGERSMKVFIEKIGYRARPVD